MATSLFDRLGLGRRRAIANARFEVLRPYREERLVRELVDALARREELRASQVVVAEAGPSTRVLDTAA